MEFEAGKPGLSPGTRIAAQEQLFDRHDLLDDDGLDADIKGAALARRIDARLDERHIFLEDGVLGPDPQRQQAVEPALDWRQVVKQAATLVGQQLQSRHFDEALEGRALELAAIQQRIPLQERVARIVAFQIIHRIEKILAPGLSLSARERPQTVEPPGDRADEAPLAPAVGRHWSEDWCRHLVGPVRASKSLDRSSGAPARLEEVMDPPLVRRAAAAVGMIASARPACIGEDEAGL